VAIASCLLIRRPPFAQHIPVLALFLRSTVAVVLEQELARVSVTTIGRAFQPTQLHANILSIDSVVERQS
jgi:hypothetical protein